HVLDTAAGKPAQGIPVTLDFQIAENRWKQVGKGETDGNGRLQILMKPDAALKEGVYRLTFETGKNGQHFFPYVCIVFRVDDPAQHYHIPLLVSPFGYTTYRGS